MQKNTLRAVLRSQESALRKSISTIENIRNWFVDNDYDNHSGFSFVINDMDETIKLLEKAKRFISEHADCTDRVDASVGWSERVTRMAEAEAAAKQHADNNPEPAQEPQPKKYRSVTEADIGKIVEVTNDVVTDLLEVKDQPWQKRKLTDISYVHNKGYYYLATNDVLQSDEFTYARIETTDSKLE